MKVLFAFLTGYALLSQPDYVVAQPPPAAQRSVVDDLFVTTDWGPPAPAKTDPPKDKGDKPAGYNVAMLKACCEKITKDIRRIYFLNNHNGKMKLQVRGLYTRSGALFFALRLKNRSPLNYNIDSIGFFVMQKRVYKQPPVRLKRLCPVYVYDSAVRVDGFERVTSVIVLPRPRLTGGQRLLIEVSEKNGGRQLEVLASHFFLENARLI